MKQYQRTDEIYWYLICVYARLRQLFVKPRPILSTSTCIKYNSDPNNNERAKNSLCHLCGSDSGFPRIIGVLQLDAGC